MRVLITGASGFAGRHLAQYCHDRGAEVTGLGRRASDAVAGSPIVADLHDRDQALAAVREARPDRVFHLAADASVAHSWADPGTTIGNNLVSTTNLLEGVRSEVPAAAVLLVGSGEQYGPVPAGELPVVESRPLSPRNPYAVSKAMIEGLADFYERIGGLRIVRARSFNHAGPGQSETYVVASFACQIAKAEAGTGSATIVTGNIDVRRDFTDVRDVARAYWAALDSATPGVYNVCSGQAPSIADILAGLAGQTRLEVQQRTDPSLLREHEVMEIRGSHDKLTAATGWRPEIPLERTLADTLDWWREKLARDVGA